jgi:hypothetical protein
MKAVRISVPDSAIVTRIADQIVAEFYLTISEGDTGDATEPIIATSDPAIIRAVIGALERRVSPGGSD